MNVRPMRQTTANSTEEITMETKVPTPMQNNELTLSQKLLAIQKECPEIEKSKVAKAKAYSWKFAPLNEVMNSVLPLFQKHNLLLNWVMNGNTLLVRVTDVNTDDMITSEMVLQMDESFQEVGMRITYYLNRMILGLIGIVAELDTGGEEKAEPVRKSRSRYSEEDEKNEYAEYVEYDEDEDEDEEDEKPSRLPRRSRTRRTRR